MILNKINKFIDNINLCESGLRGIKSIASKYDTAEIWMHLDTDGITSAINMKEYLKQYGIKTIDAHPIQYGDQEFAIAKGKPGTLKVMVDFSHAKPFMMIHTDHHQNQTPVEPGTITSFVHTPSNASYIAQIISPKEIFPDEDIKIISMIDSADFAKNNITPDDVMRAAFKFNKDIDVKKNHTYMGLVVNKLLLAYKNKPDFLKKLVLLSKPSLLSMYNVIVKLAKEEGYATSKDIEDNQYYYVQTQKSNFIGDNIADISKLKNGQYIILDNKLLVQYGGDMRKPGSYDRYTTFKNNPDVDAQILIWPMGLVQASQNPFKKSTSNIDFYHIALDIVMPKFKSKLNKDVSLGYFKKTNEKSVQPSDVGFTSKDFIALIKPESVKGLDKSEKWKSWILRTLDKPYNTLNDKEKEILDKVKINLYDLILSQSGGHKAIVNCTNLNFYGKGYIDLMKDIATEIAKELL